MVLAASHQERAYFDSIEVYWVRNHDHSEAWDYGEHSELGWGIWLATFTHDYDVNATESDPQWETFHPAPDEATAMAWATMANLGTRDPDEGDEDRSPQ